MYTSLLFSSGRLSGSFNVMVCQGLPYVSHGVLISGHKLDSESDTFDVCKHGKHFYLLEHDHKVNFVSSPGGSDSFMIRTGVLVVNFRVK